MTPPEQLQRIRIAIAKAEGYRFEDEGWRYPNEPDWQAFRAVYSPTGGFIGLCEPHWMQIPDYTGDRDSVVSAAVKLCAAKPQQHAYVDAVGEEAWMHPESGGQKYNPFLAHTLPAWMLARALCKALNLSIDPP